MMASQPQHRLLEDEEASRAATQKGMPLPPLPLGWAPPDTVVVLVAFSSLSTNLHATVDGVRIRNCWQVDAEPASAFKRNENVSQSKIEPSEQSIHTRSQTRARRVMRAHAVADAEPDADTETDDEEQEDAEDAQDEAELVTTDD